MAVDGPLSEEFAVAVRDEHAASNKSARCERVLPQKRACRISRHVRANDDSWRKRISQAARGLLEKHDERDRVFFTQCSCVGDESAQKTPRTARSLCRETR